MTLDLLRKTSREICQTLLSLGENDLRLSVAAVKGFRVAAVTPGHTRQRLRLLAGNEGKRCIPIRSFITHGEC